MLESLREKERWLCGVCETGSVVTRGTWGPLCLLCKQILSRDSSRPTLMWQLTWTSQWRRPWYLTVLCRSVDFMWSTALPVAGEVIFACPVPRSAHPLSPDAWVHVTHSPNAVSLGQWPLLGPLLRMPATERLASSFRNWPLHIGTLFGLRYKYLSRGVDKHSSFASVKLSKLQGFSQTPYCAVWPDQSFLLTGTCLPGLTRELLWAELI